MMILIMIMGHDYKCVTGEGVESVEVWRGKQMILMGEGDQSVYHIYI
jgi:hypothetical protein